MNVYFLVEGKCEFRLYPAWLSRLVPGMQRVRLSSQARADNYFIFSAQGYPSILGVHLPHAITDVNAAGVYDYLVVVIDAEERAVPDKIREVEEAARRSPVTLKSARLAAVVQNRCLETWLLGNRKMLIRNPQSNDLRAYIKHYNVANDDPEAMPCPQEFRTHAKFHLAYLKAMFEERGLSYRKNWPRPAADASYLAELIRRVEESPGHLASFARFLALCQNF